MFGSGAASPAGDAVGGVAGLLIVPRAVRGWILEFSFGGRQARLPAMIRACTRFGDGWMGDRLRVVGTVTQPGTLTRGEFGDCDIVELRLDWLRLPVDSLPVLPKPVIATVRLASEGGRWSEADEDRLPVFEAALRQYAAADIEWRSRLLPAVSALAVRYQKALVVSYHDFERTPSLGQLREVLDRASNYGTIVKIATRADSEEDLQTLRELFRWNCSAALCVVGMGARAAQSRVELPRLGSCLSYGHVDGPVAPGQPSVAELRALLG